MHQAPGASCGILYILVLFLFTVSTGGTEYPSVESSTYVKGAKNPLVIHMSRVYGVCMARGYIPLCYLDNSHQALALLGFNPAASGMA